MTKKLRNRNADNHAPPLTAVGETPTHIPRVVVYEELRHLGVLHSRRQVDRLEAADKFPKRVAMGTGRVGWLATEIIKHIDDRIAERSTAKGTLGSDGTLMRKPPPIRNAPQLGAKAKRKAGATVKLEAEAADAS